MPPDMTAELCECAPEFRLENHDHSRGENGPQVFQKPAEDFQIQRKAQESRKQQDHDNAGKHAHGTGPAQEVKDKIDHHGDDREFHCIFRVSPSLNNQI